MPRSAAGRAAPSRAACARVASSARVGPLAGRTRTHAGVAVPRARRGGFAQFFSGAHGRGEAGCSEPSPRSSFSACANSGSPVSCDATRRSTSTSARLHKSRHVGPGAGARWDGIRKLPRIARRKQPPAPLSTLSLLLLLYSLSPTSPFAALALATTRSPSQPSSVRARPQPPRGSSPASGNQGGAPNENRVALL